MNISGIFFLSIITVDPDYEDWTSHRNGCWLIAQEDFCAFVYLEIFKSQVHGLLGSFIFTLNRVIIDLRCLEGNIPPSLSMFEGSEDSSRTLRCLKMKVVALFQGVGSQNCYSAQQSRNFETSNNNTAET